MKENAYLEIKEELSGEEAELLKAADEAGREAYSPYSRLRIGAAVLTKTKKTFTGANIENASFGLTMCAERTAAAKAVSSGEKEFEIIAVTSPDIGELIPCGACLQFLSEFCEDVRILLKPSSGIVYASMLSVLLPGRFRFKREDGKRR